MTVLLLFLGWIALCVVWVAMFTQRGRLIFARRGYQFRRVRRISAIAATITFVLLCAVAQKVPPSSEAGKTLVGDPPTSPIRSHEAEQSPTADAPPIEGADYDCDDLARFAEYVVGFRVNANSGSWVTEDTMLRQAEQEPQRIRSYAMRMTRIIWNSTLTGSEARDDIARGCKAEGLDGAVAALKEAADESNDN